jgi:hypothetical protein
VTCARPAKPAELSIQSIIDELGSGGDGPEDGEDDAMLTQKMRGLSLAEARSELLELWRENGVKGIGLGIFPTLHTY